MGDKNLSIYRIFCILLDQNFQENLQEEGQWNKLQSLQQQSSLVIDMHPSSPLPPRQSPSFQLAFLLLASGLSQARTISMSFSCHSYCPCSFTNTYSARTFSPTLGDSCWSQCLHPFGCFVVCLFMTLTLQIFSLLPFLSCLFLEPTSCLSQELQFIFHPRWPYLILLLPFLAEQYIMVQPMFMVLCHKHY